MKVSYYPGCSLDGTAMEYGYSTEVAAKTLGVELQELHDWSCCGASSAHVTDNMLAHALAARNLEVAEKMGGGDLVVPCAMCFQRLKAAEKEIKAGKEIEGVSVKNIEDIHIKYLTEFFWKDVGEQAIKGKVSKSLKGLNPVCYYGCLTVRPPKITDAEKPEDPQAMDKILEVLGASVKSWSYKTDCCGGSLTLTLPDVAKRLVRKLFDMAEEAGADCIVAGCPMCGNNLDSYQKEISEESGKEYNIPIFYFTELMALSFGNTSVGKWLGQHMTDPRPLLIQKGLL
ncbi:CoB--CoM heterodisulfide reductase iron-sulfur subunit B family protein [Chloroflexota bacterium]